MGTAQTILKQTNKIIPTSKGILQNVVTGVGTDKTLRALDNVVGSPLQRIASVNLPFIGSFGVIDFVNYIGHACGFKVSRKGFIAILAAKAVDGVLPSIGGFSLPGATPAGQGVQTSSAEVGF